MNNLRGGNDIRRRKTQIAAPSWTLMKDVHSPELLLSNVPHSGIRDMTNPIFALNWDYPNRGRRKAVSIHVSVK